MCFRRDLFHDTSLHNQTATWFAVSKYSGPSDKRYEGELVSTGDYGCLKHEVVGSISICTCVACM